MIAFKLAYRNLVGAGLRTWLNAIVLSLAFVVIIWHKGLLDGWNRQARRDTIEWEIGGGQYWYQGYDPYDPFTIEDGHGLIPEEMQAGIDNGVLTPILISQAAIYPEGRMQNILMKGIDPSQGILSLPTEKLKAGVENIPAIIGTRMASNNKLNVGDLVTLRWRDTHGTFDAAEAKIVGIFKTNVPVIDNAQMWIPLERLRAMTQMPGEATIIVADKNAGISKTFPGWTFKGYDVLLVELDQIIKQKTIGGSVLYILLLLMAMLAIFDTQVLSIFRRQKEIGTDMALGMTRGQVVRLFTVEGAMHSILAAILAAIYGIPLLWLQSAKGFSLPQAADDYGLAIAERIYPVYSIGLILGTIFLVFISATIVSYLPARKIAKMKPTDAIKGKIQ
jgi:ABC-type lipoprotein release transport system permease subunit